MGGKGDAGTGALRSRPFTIRRPYVNFRISGGNYPETLGLRLRVDGDVVRQSTGPHLPVRKARSWAVEDLVGQTAVIEIFDDEQRGWGILTVDDLVFADAPAEERPAPARWLDYGTDNYAGVTWSGVDEYD